MTSPPDGSSAVLSAEAASSQSLVHVLYRDSGGNLHLDWPRDRMEEAIADQDGHIWVDFEASDDAGIREVKHWLGEVFRFHHLAVEDGRGDPRPQGGRLGLVPLCRLLRPPGRSGFGYARAARAGCLPRLELSRHLPRFPHGDSRPGAREHPSRSSRPVAARRRSPARCASWSSPSISHWP